MLRLSLDAMCRLIPGRTLMLEFGHGGESWRLCFKWFRDRKPDGCWVMVSAVPERGNEYAREWYLAGDGCLAPTFRFASTPWPELDEDVRAALSRGPA